MTAHRLIDRKRYFDGVRNGPYPGVLTIGQVVEQNAILDEWERRKGKDPRKLSYYLATNVGECGLNLKPVREGFKKTDAEARAYVKRKGYSYAKVINGQVYYGRGRVQLTWEANYRKAGEKLGIDLVNNPDLALDPVIATKIMFDGMEGAWFTRYRLDDFFNSTKTDPVGARKIINGTDRNVEIAGYYKAFFADLIAAGA